MTSMRTVLTGGTGVIGRAAVASLRRAGHDVAVVTRSPRAEQVAAAMDVVSLRGDVLDRASLRSAFQGADVVVNLAGRTPVGHSALTPGPWRRHDLLRTQGVANVVHAARAAGVRRLVQEGVSYLYADQGDDWIDERSPLEITATTEPAAVGESHVQEFTGCSRTGVVLRFGRIVGDDQETRYWLRAVQSGRRIGLGHPADWAHVVHTDDLGDAVLAALHAPGGVYNVGAEPVQRHDLVQGYADAVHVESTSFMGPVGRWWVGPRYQPLARSLRVCSDHFTSQTGWQPHRPKFDVGWLDAALRRCPTTTP